jgi:dTDP-4-dehydrorhamnose 3,5-epimerase
MKTIGNFTFTPTKIKDVIIVEPKKFGDDRGFFMETYVENIFIEGGVSDTFLQDNQSKSKKGVLRGLHFQTENTQAKLIRVIDGQVYDVAVDLRKSSETYGQWVGVLISASNNKQLFVPKGFAHGFLVVSDTAEFVYKCSDYYNAAADGGILWNDPDIGIEWPLEEYNIEELIMSDKDKNQPLLKDTNLLF